MIGLLQEPTIGNYDLLAIQEPWRNTISEEGYNPIQSPFHLVEKASINTRVAVYINKRIPQGDWDVIHTSEDEITIRLRTKSEPIYIHNVYSPPISHAERQITPSIAKLQQLLLANRGEHIILGDFNLHHPLWNHPTYLQHHYIADELLDIIGEIGVNLITPPGLATRNCQRGPHHEKITIDLAFSTIEAIERCEIAELLI